MRVIQMWTQVQVIFLIILVRIKSIFSLVKSSTATSGSPRPNSFSQRYQQRKQSPSPTVNFFVNLPFHR